MTHPTTQDPVSDADAPLDEGPPAKQQKTGWENYQLNANGALTAYESGTHFAHLVDAPVTVLEGIGMHAGLGLKSLGCETVKELAEYKYFQLSRALSVLAKTEITGKRPKDCLMNVDKAVVKGYEDKSLKEIVKAPIHALQGLTESRAESTLEGLGVKTIEDLAEFVYCQNAEAIVEAAKYEHVLTDPERKVARELHKLS